MRSARRWPLKGSLLIPAALPLLRKVLELHLGQGQRASLPREEDPSHRFAVNASFLPKNGSDRPRRLTSPSPSSCSRGRNVAGEDSPKERADCGRALGRLLGVYDRVWNVGRRL